ncbi:MAG: hypothetical protein ACYTG7_12355 [Planctomycetota bacterium]|jgi:hypothetical protein
MRFLRHASMLALLHCISFLSNSFAGEAVGCESPHTIWINGIYNSGFEWVADSTTKPAKYGAYWPGAFLYEEGNPADLIVEDAAFRGERSLRLTPADGTVLQKVVADPRWTDHAKIVLAMRLEGCASLEVALEDGPGFTVTTVIGGGGVQPDPDVPGRRDARIHAQWIRENNDSSGIRIDPRWGIDGKAWSLVQLEAGRYFEQIHGVRPVPRLNLRLRCVGPDTARAYVDEVYAALLWPRPDAATLKRRIVELIQETLDTWFLSPEQGGLQLVDPDTGYVRFSRYHVETGKEAEPACFGGLHPVYEILLLWLKWTQANGWTEETRSWMPYLERFVSTLLEKNFHPETHLPRFVDLKTLSPLSNETLTVGAYMDFLLDVREVLTNEELRKECLQQARRTADTLIALQKKHDLPADKVQNTKRFDPAAGKFRCEWPNWFGHLPYRLTSGGLIDDPERVDASWVIVSGETIWYHVFRSMAGILRVHAQEPRAGDLASARRILEAYRRPWDATRYDLENDTDDFYGHQCDDLLRILNHVKKPIPEVLSYVQGATDHRLERKAACADETLWIQAVRLGTACAGDSPRALRNLLHLYHLPSGVNPEGTGNPLYREAILELARNDLKGRQLTNTQFTESYFKHWEMVPYCFRGTYQGDCREKPAEFWQGDVGDIFGGPPTSAILAQSCGYRAALPGERQQFLSALGMIMHATDSGLKRRHGYAFGLDPAAALQYGLPHRYVKEIALLSAAGVRYSLAWFEVLPHLDACPMPPVVLLLESKPSDEEKVRLEVRGPPEGLVSLPIFEGPRLPFPAPISHKDGRMTAFPLPPDWQRNALRLDGEGRVETTVALHGAKHVLIQPLLLDPLHAVPLSVGPAFVLRPRSELR